MSGQERYAGRPEVYRVLVDLAGLYEARFDRLYDARSRVALAGACPDDTVGYSYRLTVRINIHEPDDEVRVGGEETAWSVAWTGPSTV